MSMEEVRATQLDILDKVSAFCDANGLRYYLWAGTLLGAVRHGGYIPWDDDIDIAIPRRDYERLCASFEGQFADLVVHTDKNTAGYTRPFARIGDRRTVVRSEARMAVPIGAFIDVFPIDQWPSRPLLRSVHGLALSTAHQIVRLWASEPYPGRSRLKRIGLSLTLPVVQRIPVALLSRMLTWIATRPSGGEYCGVTVFKYMEMVPCPAYAASSPIAFEGRNLAAPSNSDAILSNLYGNYMELPPEEKRVSHHQWSGVYKIASD